MEPLQKGKGSSRNIQPISTPQNTDNQNSVNVGTKYNETPNINEEGGFIDKPISDSPKTVVQKTSSIIDNDKNSENTVMAIKVIIVIIGVMITLQGIWDFIHPDKSVAPPVNNFFAAVTIIFGLGLFFRKEIIRKVVLIITCIQLALLILAFVGVISIMFIKPTWFFQQKNLLLVLGGVFSLLIYAAIITILSLKKVRAAFN